MKAEILTKIIAEANLVLGIRDEILKASEAGLEEDDIRFVLRRFLKIMDKTHEQQASQPQSGASGEAICPVP